MEAGMDAGMMSWANACRDAAGSNGFDDAK